MMVTIHLSTDCQSIMIEALELKRLALQKDKRESRDSIEISKIDDELFDLECILTELGG